MLRQDTSIAEYVKDKDKIWIGYSHNIIMKENLGWPPILDPEKKIDPDWIEDETKARRNVDWCNRPS